MAKYSIESYTPQFEKSFKLPMINLIPGIVWSIPLHQKLFPNASWWMTFGLCATFVLVYLFLSYMPIAAIAPCVTGAIIFTTFAWAPADLIGNTVARIIVKVLILAFMVLLELCVFINATLPWMEGRLANKPNIRVEK